MSPAAVFDAQNGIDKLLGAIAPCVRGEIRVLPSSYAKLTYFYRGGGSDNFDEVTAAIDMTQLLRGDPITCTPDVLLAYGLEKAKVRALGEKEAFSWIYTEHSFLGKLVQLGAAYELAKSDPRWTAVAEGHRAYLRAWVGWLAITAGWGPGRDKTADQNVPLARVVRCTGPFIKGLCGASYVVAAGKRSWRFDDGAWRGPLHAGPVFLSIFGYGEKRSGSVLYPSQPYEACKAKGWNVNLFSDEERVILQRAGANAVDSLRWVKDNLIRDYVPADPGRIDRTTLGVQHTNLSWGDAPTSTIATCAWLEDGTVWFAGADNGGRGGRGEQVYPGVAVVDWGARKGYCNATAGDSLVRVNFDMVPGDPVWQIEWDGGHVMETFPGRASAPLPTNDIPREPSKRPSWIERMGI